MHPKITRNLLRLGQLDHVDGRSVSPFLHDRHFSAASSFQNRRIERTADRVEWDAGAGLTPMAFDLEPAISAVEALRDGRRGLGGPAIGFHLDRPRFGLGPVGLTDGLLCGFILAPVIRPP
jgi:hypothetical protein